MSALPPKTDITEQQGGRPLSANAPKSKAGRRDITLPDIVADALREHRRSQLELRVRLGLGRISDEEDLLFPTLEGALPSPRAFSAEWADVAGSIGMPDITFHALRHTHASQLIDAGVDVVTISRRLGHSGPNITLKVYAHLFRDSDDKAAQAFNEALAKLGYSVNKSAVFALANGSNWVAIPYFVQSPFFQENAQTIDFTIKEGWPSGLRHRS